MTVGRLSDGYQPRFDIDFRVGRQGEEYVRAIVSGFDNGTTEVKTDARALKTGNVYVEHACLWRDGQWHHSGIITTEATYWAFVLGEVGAQVVVAAPVASVRALHDRALAAGRLAECSRGANPTKGVLVSLGALVPWLVDATVAA